MKRKTKYGSATADSLVIAYATVSNHAKFVKRFQLLSEVVDPNTNEVLASHKFRDLSLDPGASKLYKSVT